jgi:hypothetical protein
VLIGGKGIGLIRVHLEGGLFTNNSGTNPFPINILILTYKYHQNQKLEQTLIKIINI